MSSPNQKQPLLKKITRGLTVGSVITGSTFFHGPPVLALGLTKLFKKSKKWMRPIFKSPTAGWL